MCEPIRPAPPITTSFLPFRSMATTRIISPDGCRDDPRRLQPDAAPVALDYSRPPVRLPALRARPLLLSQHGRAHASAVADRHRLRHGHLPYLVPLPALDPGAVRRSEAACRAPARPREGADRAAPGRVPALQPALRLHRGVRHRPRALGLAGLGVAEDLPDGGPRAGPLLAGADRLSLRGDGRAHRRDRRGAGRAAPDRRRLPGLGRRALAGPPRDAEAPGRRGVRRGRPPPRPGRRTSR